MHKKYVPTLALLVVSAGACPAIAADADSMQRCNLQARELALQVNEKLLPDLDAEMRSSLAMLAEEVCLDYLQASAAPVPDEGSAIDNTAAPDDQGSDGPFGDLRMIEPEDRVQRPGLKRR